MFKQNDSNINQKIDSEIAYLDGELVDIANKLNDISYEKYRVNSQKISEKSVTSENSQSKEKSSSGGGSNEKSSGESGEEGKESQSSNEKDSGEKNQGNSEESEKSNSNENYEMQPVNILNNNPIIDWNELISKTENLYTSWTTIANDLKQIGVSQEQIELFETDMDNLAISIKNRDKNTTIESIIKLYEHLPQFEEVNQNQQDRKILECKNSLLNCYRYADAEEWELFTNSSTMLKMNFSNIISQKDNYKNKNSNIENASTIINEINNTDSVKDKQVFFIKYKNLMQELDSIKENDVK